MRCNLPLQQILLLLSLLLLSLLLLQIFLFLQRDSSPLNSASSLC
jgi:hypothetical protein